MKPLVILVSCLLVSTLVPAANNIYLRSLENASTVSLPMSDDQDNQLIMLFQKDCSACKQQLKDFSCLPKKVKVLLVGAFSQEQELRQEVRKLNTPYPSYLGDQEVLKQLNFKSGLTPQMVLWNHSGERFDFLGHQACEKLLALFEPNTN